MDDPSFASAVDLAASIKRRRISASELLAHFLDRVARFNPSLNAIIVQMRATAEARAKRADEALAGGEDWGPLHGVPMTVKESYNVAGTPTTWGLAELKDNVAREDALSVARLQAAGAIVFGKTNVPVMLSDFQSYNDIYGTTNNPWDAERVPGGSSGGSAAALAAGLTGLEAGSDIGGSIRNPAHFCGVFGHKPTWNLLPPRGHATPGVLSPADISVIGPLARSAADLEAALGVMAGPDEIAAHGLRVQLPRLADTPSNWRVAVWRDDPLAPVDEAVSARVDAVAEALRRLGAQVSFDARPVDAQHSHRVYQYLLQATMAARLPEDRYAKALQAVSETAPDDAGPRAAMARAQVARFRDWTTYNEQRTRLRWAWHEFFQHWDALVAPIMATPAFPHDHRPFGERTVTVNGKAVGYFDQVFWAGLASVAYLPSTVLPTGPDRDGLPIGVQIIGPEYGDLATIGMAQALEREGFAFTPPPGY